MIKTISIITSVVLLFALFSASTNLAIIFAQSPSTQSDQPGQPIQPAQTARAGQPGPSVQSDNSGQSLSGPLGQNHSGPLGQNHSGQPTGPLDQRGASIDKIIGQK
ncbi:MAG: hypothetical protein ABJB76_02535 [Candidatus Nitrosocosmicus sp.]